MNAYALISSHLPNSTLVNMSQTITKSTSRVDCVYETMKDHLVNYRFRLGERLNEVELAKRFTVSRTPLREVFNRLTAEGWLTFVPNKGFFCRSLEPQSIFDLYEVRRSLEEMSLRLTIERASDEDIAELAKFGRETRFIAEDTPIEQLVALDEEFHQKIAELSENSELARAIRAINERLHFIRWVALSNPHRRQTTYEEHLRILDALRMRDVEAGLSVMQVHVTRHREEIITIVKESVAHLYVDDLHNRIAC
jgi:DNA-binding GntR family transcriptional regulator